MTQPETHENLTDDSAQGSHSAAAAEAALPQETRPAPEPWTGERASEWNNYYDLYVTLGVLLLVFVASANKITHPSIWSQLQVGRLIAARNAPILTDVFSYTREGEPWVNVPWLYEWGQALVHKAAYQVTPGDPTDRTALDARADQVAAGTLVALNALVRVFTALLLLGIRRDGPGRWWSAFCVTLALGAIIGPGLPATVLIGGLARPATVGPPTWGLFLLTLEVWLLHRTIDFGPRTAAVSLIPLFMLWANVDESFLIGLFVLAACAIGRLWTPPRRGKVQEPQPWAATNALMMLAGCVAACVVNPSHVAVFRAAADPFFGLLRPASDVLTPDLLSLFSESFRKQSGNGYLKYFLAVVGLGYASFALNRRRFSLSWFLMYTVGALLWGTLLRYSPEFSILFAATLALNGQQWYHDTYGTTGRIGTGWALWSVGGRAITILAIFVCVAKVLLGGLPITALAATEVDSQFGFGYDRDDFAFEAADFLKDADFPGNVLNTTKAEGDALIWRAYPKRKVYIDNRPHLYSPELFNRLQKTREALRDDDVENWKPLLDQYKITAVMVPATAPRTYQVLMQSKNWVPFYDDGAVSMFGRADAPKTDLAFFQANRLDPDILAFTREKRTPPADRPPTAVTWMDHIFLNKRLARPQPHNAAAEHWLTLPGPDSKVAGLPDPARCLLAVHEARIALASKPDDNVAFRFLAIAYRYLLIQETALMSGLKLTPETTAQVSRITPRASLLPTRFRQLITALNYAIQTTPPPKSIEERQALRELNVQLFQLFMTANFHDLARDRLQAIYDQSPVDSKFSAEDRATVSRDLADLNDRVKQIEERMTTLSTEQSLSPVQLARDATNQGAPGLAIHELEEAEKSGTNPAQVKPLLLDLYCDTGQPDKAAEMLSSGTINDPSFGIEPGVSAMRQGRVYYLLGNAEYSGTLWDKYAIPALRYDRANKAIGSAVSFLRGDVRFSVGEDIQIPGSISRQADWEFEAGLCFLEGGIPAKSAKHFTAALTLSPKLSTRPIIAYYLEKLGKPVPPIPEKDKTAEEKPRAKAEKDDAEPKK